MTVDAALFRSEAIDDEMREFVEQLERDLKDLPTAAEQPPNPVIMRQNTRTGAGGVPPPVFSERAFNRTIPGPAGEITLRFFLPETVRGAYLYIHGGGWVGGAADEQDPMLQRVADNCQVAVASVEYRLAPENSYPAGPDDCEAAALWLIENAKPELGTDDLVIGGVSAGGQLSVCTLLRLRDKHGYTGFRGANLIYGAYDLSGTPSVRNFGDRNLILYTSITDWFYAQFVPDESMRRDPDVSPLYADLAGLPPALFTIGTLDPLLDDNLFMHARWISAGNAAELDIYPGATHSFVRFPLDAADRALTRMESFIAGCLETD